MKNGWNNCYSMQKPSVSPLLLLLLPLQFSAYTPASMFAPGIRLTGVKFSFSPLSSIPFLLEFIFLNKYSDSLFSNHCPSSQSIQGAEGFFPASSQRHQVPAFSHWASIMYLQAISSSDCLLQHPLSCLSV